MFVGIFRFRRLIQSTIFLFTDCYKFLNYPWTETWSQDTGIFIIYAQKFTAGIKFSAEFARFSCDLTDKIIHALEISCGIPKLNQNMYLTVDFSHIDNFRYRPPTRNLINSHTSNFRRCLPTRNQIIKKSSRANSSRASGVAKQLISPPRAAHPQRSVLIHGNSNGISYELKTGWYDSQLNHTIPFLIIPLFLLFSC